VTGDVATAAAAPLPSATVALVRDTDSAPELLMVLRHSKGSFADSYVFPGGLLEPQDFEVDDRCRGIDAGTADATLGLAEGGLAYYSAAIRELFEEVGVLLAVDRHGEWVPSEPFADARNAVFDGSIAWPEFLATENLYLACDALHYFSWWVTPREAPRRFSTRFFVAAMPAGQTASHCNNELVDSRWLSARTALDEGEVRLPHPTEVSLNSLAGFGSVDEMIGWAAGCSEAGVECHLPAVVDVDGSRRVVMPGDRLYPDYGPGDD
jgi:8-oxo-dGTP pyrophosphatase MutT (NUDIX family)